MSEENTYSKIKQDFYYRYSKYAVPALEGYENDRKKCLKSIVKMVLIFVFVTISPIIILTLFIHTFDMFVVLLFFLFGVSFISFITVTATKKVFEHGLKCKIMSNICKCFPNLNYKERNLFSICLNTYSKYANLPINITNNTCPDNYKVSNLIPYYSKLFYDDCFTGIHNNVEFNIEEIEAKNDNKSFVFKGVIVTLDMNKNFKGNTIIRSDSMFHTSPSENLHHTVLEDIEFEKKFDVYTDDDVEARYLITPSLMERLKSMQVAFKADKISASFYQDKFYIALHTNKDLFALGSLTKHVCDKEQFFTMFEEILSIIKLIDHFKLNERTGL